jgi:hypothetical protein
MENLIYQQKERTSIKRCENRVLMAIFVCKGEEVLTEDCRKLNSEELHDLYCSLDIIWVIK